MKVHRFVQYVNEEGTIRKNPPSPYCLGWYKEFRLTVDMDGVRYGAAHRAVCFSLTEDNEFIQHVWRRLVRQVARTIEDQITESL